MIPRTHPIRRSVPRVRPVRRNPGSQVRILQDVRHRRHNRLLSGQSVRKSAGSAAQRGALSAADTGLRAAAVRYRHSRARVGFPGGIRAGIVLGDGRAPFKREIQAFHSALASLAEIVAFVALGLTIDLSVIAQADVWIPGLILGAALAFIIRPVLVGLCLIPARLKTNERNFVLFAGLKGAVPILLGSALLAAHVPDAERLYGIVAVVVVFSVVVQGSMTPAAARLLHVPMRVVEPEPWALGVRLRDEPSGVHRLTIKTGSPADGRTIDDLADLPDDAWVSLCQTASSSPSKVTPHYGRG